MYLILTAKYVIILKKILQRIVMTNKEILEKNLQNFSERANTLIESKLILTDKAISNLLKTISITEPMKQAMALSLKDVSYSTEFLRCKTTITAPDGSVQCKLKLPENDVRLFTFIVCLLVEIDIGQRQLVDFLKEFFPSQDANISYIIFADNVLVPFKKAGESIIKNSDSELQIETSQSNTKNFFEAERTYIQSNVLELLVSEIEAMRSRLKGEMFISQRDKVECNLMVDSLQNAILSKNPKLIRIVWVGFKNTLNRYKSMEMSLKELENHLISANII